MVTADIGEWMKSKQNREENEWLLMETTNVFTEEVTCQSFQEWAEVGQKVDEDLGDQEGGRIVCKSSMCYKWMGHFKMRYRATCHRGPALVLENLGSSPGFLLDQVHYPVIVPSKHGINLAKLSVFLSSSCLTRKTRTATNYPLE